MAHILFGGLMFTILTVVSASMLRQWQQVGAKLGRLGQGGIVLIYAGMLMGGAGFFLIFLGQDIASQYFEAAKIPTAVGLVCGLIGLFWHWPRGKFPSAGRPSRLFTMMGRPGAALVCTLLEISIIGWIPAAIWVGRVSRDPEMYRRIQQGTRSLALRKALPVDRDDVPALMASLEGQTLVWQGEDGQNPGWMAAYAAPNGKWTLLGGADRLAYFLGDGANSRVWPVPRDEPL